MHASAFDIMKRLVKAYAHPGCSVLEIGSRQTFWQDKSYRDLFDGTGLYIGVDAKEGENVDIVVPERGDWPHSFWENRRPFDVVVSGSCLEHCAEPWVVVSEAAHRLQPGGVMLLVAPFVWKVHHKPDYFRFTDEGLRSLMTSVGLEIIESGINKTDVHHADAWAAGRTKAQP